MTEQNARPTADDSIPALKLQYLDTVEFEFNGKTIATMYRREFRGIPAGSVFVRFDPAKPAELISTNRELAAYAIAILASLGHKGAYTTCSNDWQTYDHMTTILDRIIAYEDVK